MRVILKFAKSTFHSCFRVPFETVSPSLNKARRGIHCRALSWAWICFICHGQPWFCNLHCSCKCYFCLFSVIHFGITLDGNFHGKGCSSVTEHQPCTDKESPVFESHLLQLKVLKRKKVCEAAAWDLGKPVPVGVDQCFSMGTVSWTGVIVISGNTARIPRTQQLRSTLKQTVQI